MQTVNVIEMSDDNMLQLTAFSDNKPGNEAAEDLFKAMMKENSRVAEEMSDEDIDSYIEDGSYVEGTYQLSQYHNAKKQDRLCSCYG